MKNLVIFMAILLLTQISASAATTNTNYNKQPAQKANSTTVAKPQPAAAKQTEKQDDNEFLLKYNINDLEVAPWLNNGVRKI